MWWDFYYFFLLALANLKNVPLETFINLAASVFVISWFMYLCLFLFCIFSYLRLLNQNYISYYHFYIILFRFFSLYHNIPFIYLLMLVNIQKNKTLFEILMIICLNSCEVVLFYLLMLSISYLWKHEKHEYINSRMFKEELLSGSVPVTIWITSAKKDEMDIHSLNKIEQLLFIQINGFIVKH